MINKKYIFLYTIGPVQSYIEQSRKTHDLYAGSKVLSELNRKGMKEIVENYNAEIVFPYYKQYENENEEISYPNRCVSIIETEDINLIGKSITNFLKKNYDDFLKNNYLEALTDMINQLKNHLEIFWVALPIDNKDSYKNQYIKLEQYMGAIKNMRTFNQINEDIGQKCTICGNRNSVVDRKYKNIFGKERLCAVCYQKRIFFKTDDKRFPSTAAVALAHWINKLKSYEEGEKLYSNFKSIFEKNNLNFSEQFFYQDNLTTNNLKDSLKVFSNNVNIKNIQDEIILNLKKIYSSMKNKSILHKYYAIVAFDGDSMGEWISGKNFKNTVDLKEAQQKLSKLLSNFTDWIRSYLNLSNYEGTELGSVIYAGGEDFLGFVPLDNLMKVLKVLRQKFKELVSDEIQQYVENGRELTFSMGVCIAHYKMPLAYVLKEVRKLEKTAKEFREKKDAIAISVIKRSGEIKLSVFGWKSIIEDKEIFLVDYIEYIKDNILNKVFSGTFIRNIAIELNSIINDEKDDNYVHIVKSEIKRMIRRAFISNKLDNNLINEMQNKICDLYTCLINQGATSDDFISALAISEFIGREQNDN